jgi:N-methylhydantoinase A/oxoprolinase/acetone carboxylase beta subunit
MPRWLLTRCCSGRTRERFLQINRGLANSLLISYQLRPRLFYLRIALPQPQYEKVMEAVGRQAAADGQKIKGPDDGGARAAREEACADCWPLWLGSLTGLFAAVVVTSRGCAAE